MAFGLVGLLIVIGVIVWIMSETILPHTQQVLKTRKEVTPKVQQIAGKDETGVDARTTITLEGQTTGGRLSGVAVTAIEPGSTLAKYFGLQVGDAIVEIAPAGGAMMAVKDMSDADNAKDQLLTAFQNSQQIRIIRGGKAMTLPVPAGAKPAPGAPAAPAAAPAGGNPLQKQLDAIKVPTH
jgi:C-terminal processing protease CtpA/Prc